AAPRRDRQDRPDRRRVLRVRGCVGIHHRRPELVPAAAVRDRSGDHARHRLRPGGRRALRPVQLRRALVRHRRVPRPAGSLAQGNPENTLISRRHAATGGSRTGTLESSESDGTRDRRAATTKDGDMEMILKIAGALLILWLAFTLIGVLVKGLFWLAVIGGVLFVCTAAYTALKRGADTHIRS